MKLFGKRSGQHAALGVHATERVLTSASVEHRRGRKARVLRAECIERTAETELEVALEQFTDPGDEPVHFVMPDDRYELLQVEAPRVEPSELRAAVRWKIRNLIDFHIDDAVIDVFEIPGQANRPQGQAMMFVVAARARTVREYIDCIESADLDLQVIDITEMALRNLAAQLEEDVRGLAMLYLSDDHGLITITQQGSLYLSRRLDFGVQRLIDQPQATQDQIALEVQRSLDYYDSHFGQPPVIALRILPGSSAHAPLIDSLRESLSVEVSEYRAHEAMELDQALPDRHRAEVLIALGGALRQEEVNL